MNLTPITPYEPPRSDDAPTSTGTEVADYLDQHAADRGDQAAAD
ncbi:hypothetical protein [Nocardia neocaledoniensis]|nr:hypothetical protein [Nocardia neocaledoniensis]